MNWTDGTAPAVVLSDRTRVDTWSSSCLQFEPEGWQRGWRDELAQHLREMRITGALYAVYESEAKQPVDVENVLFYNVGPSAFRHLTSRGIAFERSFSAPTPPPHPTSEPVLHHQTYTGGIDRDWFRHWRLDQLFANWVDLPLPEVNSGVLTASRVWARTLATTVGPSGPPARRFGLRIRVSGIGPRPLVSILKPLLDGVISAFHQHEGAIPTALVERTAVAAGLEPRVTFERLLSARQAVLGPRRVVRPTANRVAWNPRDDDCVACVVTAHPDGPTRMSGEIFSVVEAGSPDTEMVAMTAPRRLWETSEWDALRRGNRPRSGEDYWWVVTAGNLVRVHRTPTGRLIFEAEFARQDDRWGITRAWVHGDASDPGDANLLDDVLTTAAQESGDHSATSP